MPNLHWKVLQKNLVKNFKIFKGDLVQIIHGKDKGKQGQVKKIFRKKNRLVVKGLRLYTKFTKKKQDKPSKSFQRERSIHYSNVMLVDPLKLKPTRVSIKFLPNGKRVRVSKLSGEMIPKPKGPKDKYPNLKKKKFLLIKILHKKYLKELLLHKKKWLI